MLRRIYFSFLALALLPFLASAQGVIQTVAGGGPNQLPALSASLNSPSAVAVDKSGNVYVAVANDMRVYKIDTTGKLTVLAGNGVFGYAGDGGPATSAEFQFPSGLAVDGSGNVFISDAFASVVREVVASTGNIQTVAGNGAAGYSGDGGPAVNAGLNSPEGIAVDNSGNLFIADTSNSVVREVVAATGNIQTVAGNGTSGYTGDGGLPTAAELQIPEAVFVDGNGNLFISDIGPNVIRKVTASSGLISTVAGNGTGGYSGDGGPATSAMLNVPNGVAVDSSGNLFIADSFNAVVREVFAATGVIQTVAGKHMMGNRPTIHHDHADHDLPVAGFAITAVAESPQLLGSGSFEEGGGYVIEHQIRAQAEQIPQFQEDLLFDARFLCAQIIQTLIPKSQLFKVHFHPAGLLPHRHPATALRIAYQIVFQPLRQSVLTARTSETIRQQRENAF